MALPSDLRDSGYAEWPPHEKWHPVGRTIAEGGDAYLNEEGLAFTRASHEYVAEEIQRQHIEIAHRQERFRGGRALSLPDKPTVILVDDGVATGSTVIAAIRALRASMSFWPTSRWSPYTACASNTPIPDGVHT